MDTKQTLRDSRAWVRDQLKISVDFWLKHGMDPEHGGEIGRASCRERV